MKISSNLLEVFEKTSDRLCKICEEIVPIDEIKNGEAIIQILSKRVFCCREHWNDWLRKTG